MQNGLSKNAFIKYIMNSFIKKFGIDIILDTAIVLLFIYWLGFNPLSIIKQVVIYYLFIGFVAVAGGFGLMYALSRAMNPKTKSKEEN